MSSANAIFHYKYSVLNDQYLVIYVHLLMFIKKVIVHDRVQF